VDTFGRHFGLTVERQAGDTGLTHNLRTAVVAPSGRLVRTWRGADFALDEIASELRKALAR
jgi:hypothetical protein